MQEEVNVSCVTARRRGETVRHNVLFFFPPHTGKQLNSHGVCDHFRERVRLCASEPESHCVCM